MRPTAEQIQERLQARLKTIRIGMLHNAQRGGYGLMLVVSPQDEKDGILDAIERKMRHAGFAVRRQSYPGGPRMWVFWLASSAS